MTVTAENREINVAPGSVVHIRDEEWLVTSAEKSVDGTLVRVQGLSEFVRDTTAAFYSALDKIEVVDPRNSKVVADSSPNYRRARLWLESTLRKTPTPLNDPKLGVSTRMLADSLNYQRIAVAKALDSRNIRPRILIADAVGLGKTLEIGMILSELVKRGRGERILIVTPRHVLEQMQHELWCRFALPFVRLDSARQAIAHYAASGYSVEDVGAFEPYDLRVIRGEEVRHVEVKGSQGYVEKVILTRNEVSHANEYAPTDLVVVADIEWERRLDGTVATGDGTLSVYPDWQPTPENLKPLSYEYFLD